MMKLVALVVGNCDNDVDDDEMGGGGCNAVALKLVN